MATLGSLVVSLTAETARFRSDLGRASQEAERHMTRVTSAVKKVGGVIAALAGVAGFTTLINETAAFGDRLAKLNTRLGVSAEFMSEMRFVADSAGVSFDSFSTSIERQVKRIGEAAAGYGAGVKGLQALGLEAKALAALAPEQQFSVLADAINNVANESDRVRIAASVWGRFGTNILQVTEGGSEAIEAMRQRARELNYTISTEAANAGADYVQIMGEFTTAVKGAAESLANDLIPTATRTVDFIVNRIIPAFKFWVERIFDVKFALKNLSGDELAARAQAIRDDIEAVNRKIGDSVEALATYQRLQDTTHPIAFRESVRDVTDAFEGERDELVKLKKQLAEVNNAMDLINKPIGKTTAILPKLTGNLGNTSSGVAKLKTAVKATANPLDTFLKNLQKQVDLLGKNRAETAAYEAALLGANAEQQALAASLAQTVMDFEQQTAAAEKSEHAVDNYATVIDETTRRIDTSVQSAIRGWVSGAEGAFDTIKNLFFDLLSEMIHAAVTRPIILQIGTSLGLGGPAGQAALGSGGSLLSGGLNLAGIPGQFLGGANTAFTTVGQTAFNVLGPGGGPLSAPVAGGFGGAIFGGLGGAYLGYQQGGVRGAALGAGAGIIGGGALGGAIGGIAAGSGAASGALAGAGAAIAAVPVAGWVALAALVLFGSGRKTPNPWATAIAGDDIVNPGFAGSNVLTGASGLDIGIDFKHLSEEDANQFQTALLGIDATLAAIVPTADLANAALGSFGLLDGGFIAGWENGAARMVDSAEEVTEFFVRDWVAATDAIPAQFQAIIAGMVGGAEELTQGLAGLFTIQGYLDSNAIDDYADAVRLANRTIFETMQEQRGELLRLTDSFDGSFESVTQLATATQQRYALELALLDQINAVSQSISGSFGDTIESIRRDLMSNEELYEHLTTQAETLSGQLLTLSDPARIAETAEQIRQLTGDAFRLLDEQQRAEIGTEFIDFLTNVETDALQRLDEVQAQIANDTEIDLPATIANAIRTAMDEAAGGMNTAAVGMNQAASTMNAAAQTPTRVQVELVGGELGY